MRSKIAHLFFFVSLFNYVSDAQVIYNAYANVTAKSGNTFTVSNVNEINHTFVVGEKAVIIQMQDNVIGTNTSNVVSFGDLGSIQSAGLYEVQFISGLTRTSGTLTTLTFSGGIANTYNINSNARVQIVTFRNLGSSFTTTSNITGLAWDGTVGGIIAVETAGDLTVAHNISADGIGFRGGAASSNFSAVPCTAASNTLYIANDNQQGFKGEGIYRNSTTTFTNCRGKILTGGGGGNNHNAGGGGGGNYEEGGTGGIGWNNCTANPGGGLGGVSVKSFFGNRVFMGGGGGGGQQNDNVGSAGGNGGGIILIRANRLLTTGSCTPARLISAVGVTPFNSGQDGAGGGGAGGTMVFEVNTYSVVSTCSVNISVNGGNGSSAIHVDTHGGGGAGGQGYVVFSTLTPTTNVLVSANNGTPGCNNSSTPCTSSAGAATGTNGGGIQPNTGGGSCTNSNLLSNPSFEYSVVPNIGNNLVGVSSWGGWTIPTGAKFNVIKTNGSAYGGGPNNAQDGTQYIDVENAAGDLRQNFTLPCTSTISFNGYFSSRETGGYVNWTGIIQIINSTGSVVASSASRNFTSADGSEEQIWYQLSGSAVLSGGTYTFSAVLGNHGNFDNAFLCGSQCQLLPVELIDFTAHYDELNGNVILKWQTASEKNSLYFTVERSQDGENWEVIKQIPSGGKSTSRRDYTVIDNRVPEKIVYYRLKETGTDYKSEYFKTVSVDPGISQDSDVLVFPNPSEGTLNIKSNHLIRSLELINSTGQVTHSSLLNETDLKIQVANKGIYYLKILLDSKVLVKKIVIR